MAGFLYCIRVLLVEHTLPSAIRAEQTKDDIDRFLELWQKYLVVGGYCPTGFIIKWLGYGKMISMQREGDPVSPGNGESICAASGALPTNFENYPRKENL
jgi:hypothetical protein